MPKRNMPTCRKIIEYWDNTLVDMGKVDEGELMLDFKSPSTGICFACGRYYEGLHRAHIKPKVHGGEDSVENLHLLCDWCHNASEMLEDEQYWEWFEDQDMMSCITQIAFTVKPSLVQQVLGKKVKMEF